MNVMKTWIVALLCLACTESCSSTGKADADSAEFVHLCVVDKASGKPAPGAQVFYLDRSRYDARVWVALGLAALSPEDMHNWFCDSVIADASGRARIPWSQEITAVEAYLGSQSGTARFDPEKRETVLVQLEPDHVKRIAVVDSRGNPVAGVPLLLIGPESTSAPETESKPVTTHPSVKIDAVEGGIGGGLLWFGRSRAPDGVVEVTNWREIEARAGAGARVRLCALADFPDQSRWVDVHRDDQPTRLTVPIPGVVVVNVRRADGAPAPRDTVVMLASEAKSASRRSAKPGNKAEEDGIFENRVTLNGQAIFPGIWTGRTLNVSARSWDGSRGVDASIAGPDKAGDTVVIDLALGARLPTLTGRLVDEQGAPMAWTFFDIHWKGDKPDLGLDTGDAITDGTGRFRLDLDETPAVSAGQKPELEIFMKAVVARGDVAVTATEDVQVFANQSAKARVSVTKPLTPGDIDLGDIVLRQSKK